jgi:KUP system potassium uptake protein
MIGGAALLADGMITPPISITAAVEGLEKIQYFKNIEHYILYIVLGIIALFFFLQQFGTASIGKLFGPVMLVWFSMLAILGLAHLSDDFSVIRAVSPHYAITFLRENPNALWILGAIFLCTTGAEALYSDLGHCGRSNIRISWFFVKSCLILNYLGQGAYLLSQHNGIRVIPDLNINPFYDLMPHWFIIFGVIIATSAAIIASQAMVSGSYTLISEAYAFKFMAET